ncbi:MAG: copper ABC transporter substrate-binding protein, partial [Thermoplasmata archaeon]|nr:copper ABC transporter substrate-binding protein [Thermoplasmata archaeon]
FLDFHKLFIITHPIFTFPHPKESHPLNYWNNSKYGNYYQWWAERNDTNDKNGDGIVDYPWVMNENNTDYHPLKSPYVWKVENKNNRVERPYYSTHISIIFILLIVIILVLLRIRKKQL